MIDLNTDSDWEIVIQQIVNGLKYPIIDNTAALSEEYLTIQTTAANKLANFFTLYPNQLKKLLQTYNNFYFAGWEWGCASLDFNENLNDNSSFKSYIYFSFEFQNYLEIHHCYFGQEFITLVYYDDKFDQNLLKYLHKLFKKCS